MTFFAPYVLIVAEIVALIGGGIMLVGVAASLYRLILVEISSATELEVEHSRQTLRHHLGYYILLGLEFIIVADILRTIFHPGLDELMVLGIVVLLRTIISVTLNWELGRVPKTSDDHP